MRILFVCLGNICRSPLAEGVLRRRLAEAGLEHVEIDSAGTGDWHVGQPPDSRTVAVARARGLDISGLRARQVHMDDFHAFDLILCADRSNLQALRRLAPPDARAEIALIRDWAGAGQDGLEVPDPYTGGAEDFEAVHAMLDAAAEAIVARLHGRPAPAA
ncbi:low molecular weight protein-tyrosine-phosphatase [Coralloluteibacterium stylophorae]|uniref:protein-tyrosine-phosphatase n=1 Tax=Coralloluteibacterium stylophorae TaxID=1776034 RepID=A0A8J7VRL3_9GAMM|nr:low molecular weight protein-tyrosine-phosphatase [Coralloluteibacterium stylophorae]MBS7455813.1 low molecular weight phosphotyrosine protein phosphatase [Coralloluteibacterium stylophorae]